MKTKIIQKWLCGISTLTICFMLIGCGHEHTWIEATCTEPKTCSECGETEGEPLGHTWVEATCTEPKTCSVCGETEGEPLGHTLTEANYQQPATCEVCGETVGEPLQAEFEQYGLVCDAELDTPYPYVTICGDAPEYTTIGNLTFTDYEVFSEGDNYEAKEGYEWRAVTLAFSYDDDNAKKYGSSTSVWSADYYDVKSTVDTWDDSTNTYTVNYNGIDYTECTDNFELLQSGWDGDVFIKQYRYSVRIPQNYDGAVAIALNYKLISQYVSGETHINDLADDDTIFFRLK